MLNLIRSLLITTVFLWAAEPLLAQQGGSN